MLTTPLINDRFVPIKAVSYVQDAIAYAMHNPYPSHVISDPGRGKTTALYHLAREYSGVYLEIGEQQKDIAGLYRGLLEAAESWYDPHDSRRSLCDRVITEYQRRVDWSRPNKDLVVVDEFQTAEDRTKRELLRLHETCGFALVLSGNSERIASSSKTDPNAVRQIEDRIGMRVHLPGLDQEDCNLLADAYGIAGQDAIHAVQVIGRKTNARNLGRVLQLAGQMTGDSTPVRLAHIMNALNVILGATAAHKLLKSKES